MSKLKVNELDTRSGTDITVTTGKTVVIPAGATITVAGTANLTSSTLTLPATLPATALTNATAVPAAQLSGQVPLANLGNVDTTGLQDDIALLGFKTQANGSLAKYSLVDQTLDAFEDATGVDASASTDETRNSASKYYSGVADATGGTITTHGSYTVHSFLANGNFVVGAAGDIDYLLVGGGGGAGSSNGGGGGGGGVRSFTSHPVTAQTYAIVVGAGGIGSDYDSSSEGTPGTASTGFGNSAAGGGTGAQIYASMDGQDGGSGGGADSRAGPSLGGTGGSGNTPSTSPVQGYDGGDGSPGHNAGAGGGGAGAVGANVTSLHNGGNGGVGIQNDFRTGSNVYYGGGGGGMSNGGTLGTGGLGGGGDGVSVNGTNPENGTANTGGGAGGGFNSYNPAGSGRPLGGTGIVVIRYTGSLGAVNNMTLVSTATTAQAVPTKGDVVLTYTNAAGTATINTDLIASVSRDNGTTYTAVTLASQGTTGGHTILTAHDVSISGQPSGSEMRWKVATANQSTLKETRIHAVSLGWS